MLEVGSGRCQPWSVGELTAVLVLWRTGDAVPRPVSMHRSRVARGGRYATWPEGHDSCSSGSILDIRADEIKKSSRTHYSWVQNVSPNNTQATPVSLRVVAEGKQIGNWAPFYLLWDIDKIKAIMGPLWSWKCFLSFSLTLTHPSENGIPLCATLSLIELMIRGSSIPLYHRRFVVLH